MKRSHFQRIFRGILTATILLATSPLFETHNLFSPIQAFAAGTQEEPSVSADDLNQALSDNMMNVKEFAFIRSEASKLGVDAYLFGGTASGYGFYEKWNLLRKKGDQRFQADRFDHDYTNIYRSTQDLDIVIDGTPAQASKLQSALAEHFPHLKGSKTAWEVRLLREPYQGKMALLNDYDFLHQHSDSASTGLIQITLPKPGQPIVRDLKDWDNPESLFLTDLLEDKIHFYFSPDHKTTQPFKDGKNDPIKSVVRYLTKTFQYELQMRPEDVQTIKKMVAEFDPSQASYELKDWLERRGNGAKLFQHAVNLEYAWNVLEDLGLRQKLIQLSGDTDKVDSLAWWMNKEPLRSSPLDPRAGKTAKQLGIDIVAHETNKFLSYESITRSHKGEPNVFISREDAAGEMAVGGNGFYTAIGKKGARGTGLTIRFTVDPDAVEGRDFKLMGFLSTGDYVVFRNKRALHVIPESLNFGPVEYFRFLASDDLSNDDLGTLEKLNRRIKSFKRIITPEEKEEIAEIVKNNLSTKTLSAWNDFFGTDITKVMTPLEVAHSLVHIQKDPKITQLLKDILSKRDLELKPKEEQELAAYVKKAQLSDPTPLALIDAWYDNPGSPRYPDLFLELVQSAKVSRKQIESISKQTRWRETQVVRVNIVDAYNLAVRKALNAVPSQPARAGSYIEALGKDLNRDLLLKMISVMQRKDVKGEEWNAAWKDKQRFSLSDEAYTGLFEAMKYYADQDLRAFSNEVGAILREQISKMPPHGGYSLDSAQIDPVVEKYFELIPPGEQNNLFELTLSKKYAGPSWKLITQAYDNGRLKGFEGLDLIEKITTAPEKWKAEKEYTHDPKEAMRSLQVVALKKISERKLQSKISESDLRQMISYAGYDADRMGPICVAWIEKWLAQGGSKAVGREQYLKLVQKMRSSIFSWKKTIRNRDKLESLGFSLIDKQTSYDFFKMFYADIASDSTKALKVGKDFGLLKTPESLLPFLPSEEKIKRSALAPSIRYSRERRTLLEFSREQFGREPIESSCNPSKLFYLIQDKLNIP
jgi:hypothetical protein